MFHQSQTQAKLSIFRKEECSLIHYSLGWAAGVVRSQQQPGHWWSGLNSPMLVGNCREAPHMVFMQPSSKSWKDFKLVLFRGVRNTDLVTVFKGSQCCQCDKQPEVQCEFDLLSYFIVWQNKKGNWGTTEIVTTIKVDLNPLLCIRCKRTLRNSSLSA